MTQTSLFSRPPVVVPDEAAVPAPWRHAIHLAVRPIVTDPRPAPSGLFSLRARRTQVVSTRPLASAA